MPAGHRTLFGTYYGDMTYHCLQAEYTPLKMQGTTSSLQLTDATSLASCPDASRKILLDTAYSMSWGMSMCLYMHRVKYKSVHAAVSHDFGLLIAGVLRARAIGSC